MRAKGFADNNPDPPGNPDDQTSVEREHMQRVKARPPPTPQASTYGLLLEFTSGLLLSLLSEPSGPH